ncbi:MAG: glycogen debranching protein [Chitinophagaceae bacterium]|nr:glycogen debranching protein [Chitinophagaceae bacterium]
MKKLTASTLATLLTMITTAQTPIYQSKAYTIFPDKVVQEANEAKALSAKQLVSNYKSPANLFQSATISFKFAINGRDNEMLSGKDHHYSIPEANGTVTTPAIIFGQQFNLINEAATYLQPNTSVTIKLDMRAVMQQFTEKGFYTTFNGDKIYKEDYKGVFIAGGSAPLIWDFDNLANHKELQLQDPDGDGIYEITLVFNKQSDEKHTDATWELSKDISPYPQYKSGFLLSDALYNLSLEEMLKAIEKDSTFRTGREWSGVWTRDISYSIILSMAHMQPEVAKKSLMRKVNARKRVIQDTGTGGAWPASTDRMIWAVAAWEIYKATGDEEWLKESFVIIKNSIEDDLATAYDIETGLVKGESSFLDWRDQTYPKWMQPADIFESECLGTNAVHYQANIVLSNMAALLKEPAFSNKHLLMADRIKNGINRFLWMPDKGYYAQYLYGRNSKMISPRSEALGEALCIIFGIADNARAKQIVASVPVTDFGIPCIAPQIPSIPPYHNNGIWPFVQTFWLWASAAAGNEKSVMESIGAIYRPAALFLTNKENFVATTGDFNGTQINSSIMLWSLSGNISLIHKGLFGIRFNESNLSFEPFVPKALAGNRSLTNFHYRKAELDIQMEGYGNRIASFEVDGKKQTSFQLPATISGKHTIRIVLSNTIPEGRTINKRAVAFTLPAPVVSYNKGFISWQAVEKAVAYKIIKNGVTIKTTSVLSTDIPKGPYAEYQVISVDKEGRGSFASEPIVVVDDKDVKILQAEGSAPKADLPYKGYTGDGFVEISTSINRNLSFNIDIPVNGWYAVDFRYANGNGPTNTENKCAIRTLQVDGKNKSAIVFPQRGKEEWSNWGYTNSLKVFLAKGKHSISLSFEEVNENMNGVVNQAMVDCLRVSRIK